MTKRGRERTSCAADGLGRFLGRASRVVTSPLVRARQTAELVREAVAPNVRVEVVEALAPGAPYREIVRWLRGLESGASVVLVGHEPHLGKLAGVLLFGSPGSGLAMKKAGATVIDFVGQVEPGAGRLYAFLPPRVMRRLARQQARA